MQAKRLLFLALLAAGLAVAAAARDQGAADAGAAPAPDGELSACLNEPTISSVLPADALLTEQPEVNCFAWQEFIALNWRASPTQPGQPDPTATAAQFGDPGAAAPVVWETYEDVTRLFLPGGKTPQPWGTPGSGPPAECRGIVPPAAAPGDEPLVLKMIQKFSPELGDRQVLDEVNEAGVTPPAWLTAQSRKTVHYEVRVNQDFFNYVVDPQNQFYDSRYQAAAVQPGAQGIDFPNAPSQYGQVGAMELKSGWLEIEPAQRGRYLTTEALIVEPDGKCRNALVGLVMIHIIHKTKTMPNWTWATFEHVDNAPDRVEVEGGKLHPPYTFYKPDCQPPTAPECVPNRKPQMGDPMDRPIQVVREVPIPGYVRALNERVHATIKAASPASVFQYYHLINTLWPQSGMGFPVGGLTPLSQGAAAPTTGLSNTAAETYVQTLNCLDCHQYAPIACSSGTGPDPAQAADYSFQLSRASEPSPPGYCGGKLGLQAAHAPAARESSAP